MNNFGTKGVEEKVQISKYTQYGINDDITIGTIKGIKAEGAGSDYIDVNVFPTHSAEEFSTSVRLYMSERAKDKSMEKLLHLATKITTREKFDSITSDSIQDYGTKVNAILKGGRIRMKFKGREYIKQNGNKGIRLEFPFAPFAEALNDGAEYPAITKKDTKLKFDKDNNYDYEVLAQPQTVGNVIENDGDDDLPM